jgi:4-hydroxy-3-polyprenylbenzoate decarboxylase
MKTKNVVLAISGASGVIYAVRLLEVLIAAGYDVYLSISPSAQKVLKHELDLTVDLDDFSLTSLLLSPENVSDSKLDMLRSMAGISSHESNVLSFDTGDPGEVHYCHYEDMMAPIASGSFPTAGMVICPCSGSTLGAVVHGSGNNLIHRAAGVHLKERRKLILVPRETPLSTIQLDNMKRASEVGAVVLPAMPGFYHGVTSIRDLVDFIVARICDQLGVANSLIQRWGT